MKRSLGLVAGFGAAGCLSLTAAALEWKTNDAGRHAALDVGRPPQSQPGFTRLPSRDLGVAFTNFLSDAHAAENQIRLIGSGVALGDVDGDGLCDIYLCRLEGPNVLYRNLGNWKFVEVPRAGGAECAGQYSTGAVLADIDGDGDLDLLVNGIGRGTRCFLNDGRGNFQEVAGGGLLKKYGATSLALADVDGDGDLDLYVANYRTTTIRSTGLKVLNIGGKRVVQSQDRDDYEFTPEGLLLEHGEPDQLYLNDGHGNFSPAPWTDGRFLDEDGQPLSRAPRDWGLSAMFRDVNGDGAPDLYVCNDFWSPDRFWLNDGHGRFRAAPRLAQRNSSTFSMGIDFADIDRDGHDDFLVLDMLSRDPARRLRQRAMAGQNFNALGRIEDRPQVERNTLFLNRGDNSYAEIAQLAGLHASEWSWGVVFLDVDLDGYEDVLVTNGHGFDTQDSDTDARLTAMGPSTLESFGQRLLQYPRLHVANVAFRNRGDLTFEECGARWGFNEVGVSHGIALADLDGDGDLDVVVNQLNGEVGLYRNNATAARVAVRLKGMSPNTRGIGALVRLRGGRVPQSQQILAGGRYLSSDNAERVFAADNARGPLSLEVAWPSGRQTRLTPVEPNCVYEIDERLALATNQPAAVPSSGEPAANFKNVSALLHHTHVDEPFNDWERQPLLPRRLSQLGPGVTWCDFDGDGREDLIVGSGRGGEAAFFRNLGDGRFERSPLGASLGRSSDDLATIIAWRDTNGAGQLLCGSANYENTDAEAVGVRCYGWGAKGLNLKQSIPAGESSPGALAVGDLGDGEGMVLFVGGRLTRGRYPVPAASQLLRQKAGRFERMQDWPALGLVSGALFSDLDGDGRPELIVACDWGAVKVFRFNGQRFEPWEWRVRVPAEAAAVADVRQLSELTGWWSGIAAGDFDGDGRMDLVVGNAGRNTPYQSAMSEGWHAFYGDFGGRGRVDLIEASFDPVSNRLVPWRDLDALAAAAPWLRDTFPTVARFAVAPLAEVLGPKAAQLQELRVRWPDTTLLLNRGDHFEIRSLPVEAQFAPAFAVCVGDYDADGNEDVFLSQNFFDVDEQTSRYDGGRGLWLRGDGRGNLSAIPGQQSGVRVYGEQRGAALADYDGDGRVDLVVSQNSAETQLFHNESLRAGLRVRLLGPAQNPASAGARMRLAAGDRRGPARELHVGSGYWSQDGAVQVLGFATSPTELYVRWPGQAEMRVAVPAEAREVTISPDGKLHASPAARSP